MTQELELWGKLTPEQKETMRNLTPDDIQQIRKAIRRGLPQ